MKLASNGLGQLKWSGVDDVMTVVGVTRSSSDSSSLETDISGSRSTADLIIPKTNQIDRNGLPADTEGIKAARRGHPADAGFWRLAHRRIWPNNGPAEVGLSTYQQGFVIASGPTPRIPKKHFICTFDFSFCPDLPGL